MIWNLVWPYLSGSKGIRLSYIGASVLNWFRMLFLDILFFMLVWLLLMETESVRLFLSFFIIASRSDVLVGLFLFDLRFLICLLLHNLLLAARAKRTFLRA